tara:strand:+ start:21604 stop:23346 length:1743 start_codon:yes stop_codon:yes gene_type:complete
VELPSTPPGLKKSKGNEYFPGWLVSCKMNINKKILALKYRPQVFEDLIGQEIIVDTIKKSITIDKTPNAFLFTGIRGIGKTTIARILAKSLNCLNPKNNNCLSNMCNNCEEITQSRHIDVLEMDAASKTGVDDVRDLIEFARYGPTSSKYKIFIIDEVHMLSKQAFNALLKTLEEPPSYLKFIFATTEVNKIPITVLSRCQRFDLMRVKSKNLFDYLKKILLKEKNKIDDDVLKLIVKISEGSVRDSLSLLDRALLNQYDENNKINLETAQKIFGYFDKTYLIKLVDNILRGDEDKTLSLYRNIYNQGIEPKIFLNSFLEVIYYLKNFKNLNNINSSINLNDSEIKKLETLSSRVDNKILILFWQFSIETMNELNLVADQNLSLEMFLIRLLHIKYDISKENYQQKNILPDFQPSKIQTDKEEKSSKDNEAINQIKASSQEEQKLFLDKDVTSNKLEIKSFEDLISVCIEKKEIKLKYELENNVSIISFSDNNIEISFNENLDKDFVKNISSKLLEWTGKRWIILFSKIQGLESPKQKNIKLQNENIQRLKESDDFKHVLNIFPDAEIVNINELKKENND